MPSGLVCPLEPCDENTCVAVTENSKKCGTDVSAATGGDGLHTGVTCSIETGPLRTGSLGITDNDTKGIDHITGPPIVSSIAAEVTDCSCDILLLY